MVRVSSPAKLRPWSELTAKMVMGVVLGWSVLVHRVLFPEVRKLLRERTAERRSPSHSGLESLAKRALNKEKELTDLAPDSLAGTVKPRVLRR